MLFNLYNLIVNFTNQDPVVTPGFIFTKSEAWRSERSPIVGLNKYNLLNSITYKSTVLSRDQLGSYLAGLIEGDGSITVPKSERNAKGKLLYPRIKITFALKDAPLAERILKVLGRGSLEYPKIGNYLNLLIQDLATLYKLTVILNGKMRTPKIEALYRLIEWFNKRTSEKEKLMWMGLDTSDLDSNPWLAGFLDADGNFYCNFSLNKKGIAKSIKYSMRISQRAVYINKGIENITDNSFLHIMNKIGHFLDVSKVNFIQRIRSNFIEKAYEVKTVKRGSCEKLINYLLKYPLYSSKYQDFLCWATISKMNKLRTYKTLEGTRELINLKSKMNSLRTEFDWKHLDKFYTFD